MKKNFILLKSLKDLVLFVDLDASRVYCGSFVSNEYGHILNNNSYEIVYNVCLDAEESSNYLFTQKLVSLTGNY